MGGKTLTGAAAGGAAQGGETDWKAAAFDLKEKIDGLGAVLVEQGFERPEGATILLFAGDTIVRITGDLAAAQAELAKVGIALTDAGYALDGGPEDATELDKLILAFNGVRSDRDDMRAELDKIDALVESCGFDPEKLDEDVNGAAALATIIGVMDERAKSLEDQLGIATATIETLEAKLAKAGKAEKGKAPAKKRAVALELPAKPIPAVEAALTGATTIVFSEEGGMIDDIKPIEFEPSAYRASNGRALLARKIEIDRNIGFARIDHAWLLLDGKPVSKCEVPGGIVAGGGRAASFAADTLIFA